MSCRNVLNHTNPLNLRWFPTVSIIMVVIQSSLLSAPCHSLVTSQGRNSSPFRRVSNSPFRRDGSTSRLGLSKHCSDSRQHVHVLREEGSSPSERPHPNHSPRQSPPQGGSRPTTINSNRRQALASAAAILVLPWMAQAATENDVDATKSLEDLEVGTGRWKTIGQSGTNPTTTETAITTHASTSSVVPASFSTYLARFLIQYDVGVSSWWDELNQSCSLMSDKQRSTTLGKSFGSFAASVQLGVEEYVQQAQGGEIEGFSSLARNLLDTYGTVPDAKRHIGILCALLPPNQQPVDILGKLATKTTTTTTASTMTETSATAPSKSSSESSQSSMNQIPNPPPRLLTEDFGNLLPSEYSCALIQNSISSSSSSLYTINPPINLFEVGVDERVGQTAVVTAFGPLASDALTREKPDYSLWTYALFGISGATGCALTHSVVIPLDVIKTKAQTNPDEYKDVIKGALRIVDQEGIQGLLIGAQATVAGYFWYGLSVYPSYTFFKRYLNLSLLPPEVAAVHGNDIALVAGALAAVIASLGLTPLEAARIRVVADPERYKSLGLSGTLGVIASEDAQLGWKAVYAGLPSLMARQVIFGSVKFLAFERACESIFAVWPFLRDATWTALMVSLVAGGFSGTLSSVVSQPADSVLTYVAQNSSGKGSLGVLEGCFLMVEEEGVGSLFRGLGSRCVWAGSIIAGQFLLYDVFRTSFGVSGQDLSQVFKLSF